MLASGVLGTSCCASQLPSSKHLYPKCACIRAIVEQDGLFVMRKRPYLDHCWAVTFMVDVDQKVYGRPRDHPHPIELPVALLIVFSLYIQLPTAQIVPQSTVSTCTYDCV